jgi:small subunit ribosomal protein S5
MAEENAQPTENPEVPAAAPAPEAQAAEAPAAAEAQAPEAPPQQASPVPPTAPGSQQQQQRGGGGGGGGGHGGGRGGGGRGGPGGGRGGNRGGRGGGRDRDRDESGMESAVVRIYRCSKVVKGGRTFSFGALVVAGDRKGNVGIGYGKANEVPGAVEKATKDARKSLIKVNLKGTTIPHTVKATSGASTVILVPARPGTGVTAGKSVRPCVELAGITDILTKAYGSTSPKNLVKATMAALTQLQNRDQVENNRGIQLEKGAGELVTA